MPGIVDRARQFATAFHAGQRYGDGPYTRHLEEVATIVAPWGEEAQAVAWLHDVIEDTPATAGDLIIQFGNFIAACVVACTDPPGKNRRERKKLANDTLSQSGGIPLVVKAADRLANVRECVRTGDDRLEMYRREHAEFRAAAFRSGLCDSIWAELDALLDATARRG